MQAIVLGPHVAMSLDSDVSQWNVEDVDRWVGGNFSKDTASSFRGV